MGFELRLADVKPGAQIAPDRFLPLGLRTAPERGEEVGLDPREVVLGLRHHHAEDRVGILRPADVRNAPIVADDGDALRLRGPLLLLGRRGGGQREEQRGGREEARDRQHQPRSPAWRGAGASPRSAALSSRTLRNSDPWLQRGHSRLFASRAPIA